MGNDMFHKGLLKSYDQETKTGTILLSDNNLELSFSVEDLPNSSLAPQIGERVKCFINDDEIEKQDKAKFIVRLDHKNSRTEKPLNRIFYSEEEDLKAIKDKQRLQAEHALKVIQEKEQSQAEEAKLLEQRYRDIEEEVRARVEIELAQAKKELLENTQSVTLEELKIPASQQIQLGADEEISVHDLDQVDSSQQALVTSKDFVVNELDVDPHVLNQDDVSQIHCLNHDEQILGHNEEDQVKEKSLKSEATLTDITALAPHLESNQILKQDDSETNANDEKALLFEDDLPEINDVLVMSSNSIGTKARVNLLQKKAQTLTFNSTFTQISDSDLLNLDAKNTSHEPALQPLNLDGKVLESKPSDIDQIDRSNKIDDSDFQPIIPMLDESSAIQLDSKQKSVDTQSKAITDNHAELISISPKVPQIDESLKANLNLKQSDSFVHTQPDVGSVSHNAEKSSALKSADQQSTLNKVKTQFEYKTQHTKPHRKNAKQFNPWLIVVVLLFALVTGLAYWGFTKYQDYQQDREIKAKLYLLEQQRLIEEQRKRLGKLSDKKILSDKTLDELLGKERHKE